MVRQSRKSVKRTSLSNVRQAVIEIGGRVRTLRRSFGLDQAKFIQALGLRLSIQVLSRLEAGQTSRLNIDLLVGLLAFMRLKRVRAAWLFCGAGEMFDGQPPNLEAARSEMAESLEKAARSLRGGQ